MELEHLRVVTVVYTSALLPLALLGLLRFTGRLPRWILQTYIATFLLCALGWELWFTYGWLGGDPVDLRRAPALSAAIPQNINWLLNSLADAGSIGLVGLLLVWWTHGNSTQPFREWRWSAFTGLCAWFIAQNLLVEMFLYHDQLAEGKPLSWAPLAPGGPWFNPTLIEFRDRTITLQGQVPWLLMTPLFYGLVIQLFRRDECS